MILFERSPVTNLYDVSVIVVSYNTRALTLDCLRSVYDQTNGLSFEVIVVDNASTDGSASAVAKQFAEASVIALDDNIGFARANNLASERASGEYLLLLNPDTVVLDRAIERLVAFAGEHPDAGIYGGRTVFEDGTLNPTSCWRRPTLWSEFCHAVGASRLFRRNRVFDPESLGRWPRDTVRHVDIVTGCFFLITAELWKRLGGFSPCFFMYGEEADLCLRARSEGYRPVICPTAQIVHYGGRSERVHSSKLIQLLKARRNLMFRHWTRFCSLLGSATQVCGVVNRLVIYSALHALGVAKAGEPADCYRRVWRRRREWAFRTHPPAESPFDGKSRESVND